MELPALRQVQTPLRGKEIYREESDSYIEVGDDLHFLEGGKGFILTTTVGGFNHIYRYDMDGRLIGQLTEGNWDVIAIVGVDEQRKRIIYTSAESKPTEQEIWSIGLNGRGKRLISPAGGWNDADFSNTFSYFINTFSTANDPGEITLRGPFGEKIKTLKDNATLKENLAKYPIQPLEFFVIDAGTHVLNAWMIKPVGFESREQYPVLMTIYGGPGHNTVTDSWGGRTGLWHQMLAQDGYIVISVDPRGTERRGSQFKHATYGQMGKLETEDMITTAKWLKDQPWVDGDRIGVQGWSYGGYMSSLCLMKGHEHFKSAIAVAPVTNWRFYDSIYTERYMGLPQDNAEGYDDNSPINYVSSLTGPYLLVHGTADDNVHWQNSAEMINTLVKENKDFDLHIYPDRNHGIYGGITRLHLFNKMTDFLRENL
jgi:dipeptidyl-peptidase-4